jgi:hypothetical protein
MIVPVRHIPSWVPWFSYDPLAQEGKRLSEKIKNDPINWVKNAIVRCKNALRIDIN